MPGFAVLMRVPVLPWMIVSMAESEPITETFPVLRANTQANMNSSTIPPSPVGASLLAMVVNDNAGHQGHRGVFEFIASKLAPTVKLREGLDLRHRRHKHS
jgi:hypothetical protein